MSASPYVVIKLPQVHETDTGDERERVLVQKLRQLRLDSLKISPDAFGSTFEAENLFPLEMTRARLCVPTTSNFVVVRKSPISDTADLLKDDWIGLLVVSVPVGEVGGLSKTTTITPTSGPAVDRPDRPVLGSDEDEVKVLQYKYNQLFVKPEARGNRLGEVLLKAAMDEVKQYGQSVGAERIHHTITVYWDNFSAKRSYERMGFRDVSSYWHEKKQKQGQEPQAPREVKIMECWVDLGWDLSQ